MSEDIHARAARLMDAELVEGIPATERAWLDEHLERCAGCRAHAERTERTVQSLRSLVVQINPALVSATQVRLRLRARELHEHQARMRALWVSCALSWVMGAVSAPLLWRGLAWLGQRFALPQPARLAVFLLAWTVPAVVVGAVLAWQRWRAASENGYAEGWRR